MLQLIYNTSIKAYSLNASMGGITGFNIYACLKDSIMARQQVTVVVNFGEVTSVLILSSCLKTNYNVY